MSEFITKFDDLLWSPIPALNNIPLLGWLSPLATLLVGTGIWFTFFGMATIFIEAALAQAGFKTVFGSFGNIFIAITLTFFAFSTVIGWYFFGKVNWQYLFKGKLYVVIVCICIFFGAFVVKVGANVNDIWNLQDALNGLMVIPNLIGILALTGIAVSLLNENVNKFGLE